MKISKGGSNSNRITRMELQQRSDICLSKRHETRLLYINTVYFI